MGAFRYERIRKLGRGGGGDVWLARVQDTNTLCALKFMRRQEDAQDDQMARQRFMSETEIALVVEHEHILRAFDYGDSLYNGHMVPFLVYPYKADGSLDDFARQNAPWSNWTLAQIVDVIAQAADALYYLHTHDPIVVHRDVKPANFLIQHVQRPERAVHLWLSDFGIARWQKVTSDMTMNPLGTRGYIAPELQYQGRVKPSVDQYSLAVMAYYLLTGELPYYETDSDQLLPPTRLNPTKVLYTEIDAVVLKGLAFKPGERFPTILDFVKALQFASSQREETRRAVFRLLNISFDYDGPTEKMDRDIQSILSPHQTVDMSATQSPSNLIFPTIPVDIVLEEEQPVPDEPLPLVEQKTALRPSRLSAPNFPLLSLPMLFRTELPDRPCMLRWSPGGDAIICMFYDRSPVLVYRDGRVEMDALQAAGPAHLACWSPDGSMLAMSVRNRGQHEDDNEIHFWDLNVRQECCSPLILNNPRPIDGLDWSVKGQLAVWVGSQIYLYALPKRFPPAFRLPAPQPLTGPVVRCGAIDTLRWSPDGSLLALGGESGEVLCIHAITQVVQWSASVPRQRVSSLVWSSDGSLLAVAFKNNQVIGWNARRGNEVLHWQKLPIRSRSRTLGIFSSQSVALASDEPHVLVALPGESAPSAMFPGQKLIASSPVRPELATLDAQRDTVLVMYHENVQGKNS